jgi:enoyl-CoA hydratase
MNFPGSSLQTLTEKLVATKEGSIGWIVFNNPERHNAVSLEMWQSLPRVLDAFKADSEVRVIVLRGAGEKAFVSGADISQFKEKRTSAEAVKLYNATSDAASEALRNCPKPTIAMIRFGVPAAKLGLGYRFSGINRLATLVGPSFAAEIFFTARQFTAQEALQMNLVNRVVPVAELEKFTRDYVQTIANNAPLTIAAVKRALIEYHKDPAERDLALCQKMVEECFSSEDYKEGQTAFMEKRKPVFKGR